jgi:hypothetical protein
MTHANDSLQILADRMGCGAAPPQRLRETLEASLTPLVRRALRSGDGMPQLVAWVRTNLPRVDAGRDRARPMDPDCAAPPLARLLCATLLRGRPDRLAASATETVVGV